MSSDPLHSVHTGTQPCCPQKPGLAPSASPTPSISSLPPPPPGSGCVTPRGGGNLGRQGGEQEVSGLPINSEVSRREMKKYGSR